MPTVLANFIFSGVNIFCFHAAPDGLMTRLGSVQVVSAPRHDRLPPFRVFQVELHDFEDSSSIGFQYFQYSAPPM
jgi:hypothetical protein